MNCNRMELYESSLQQLYHLYSHNGKWAGILLNLLVQCLQHQGGRCHEDVLQNGITSNTLDYSSTIVGTSTSIEIVE